MLKHFLILLFHISFLVSITEGISCYKHTSCSPKGSCIVDGNKYQCSNAELFCFNNNIFFDVAERGCADTSTCNSSIPNPGRFCCNTDYCNQAISSVQISRSILLASIFIRVFVINSLSKAFI
ncbi:unnamed protein product [Rotaria socialis]|uniref:Uncharacterized protein n=1 Tax=Rotaria socialis TaxID=392032 RepID=A0A818EXY6_9BILA|nr:unnamed protein product [Rotaria socialis]CAF3415331.1 unnamed protein product [Rotaria socialis]CAF3466100.1 unnamed protein product [Rotaria socialis]CAF3743003.1 unnamed protein product [Rotaria socialis]CAF3800845.1 unnamed protein product [Rotaria socialis]